MKLYVVLIAGVFISLLSCQNQEAKPETKNKSAETDTANFTAIRWIDSVKDIGTVDAGKIAEIKFKFQNVGNKPLFIIAAQPGCGCTVADYPKGAIAPGEEGEITANFDTKKGGGGSFRKSISVTTNTKPATSNYIFFFGNIKASDKSSKTGEPAEDGKSGEQSE